MKKWLGAVACAVLGCAGAPAMAADLPLKAPPAPMVGTWGGFYVGAFAGGTFGHTSTAGNGPQVIDLDPSGATLGGLVGYNYQIGTFVLGLEGDAGWTNSSGSLNYIATSGAAETETNQSSYVAHLRGRIGLAYGNFMPFIAGGASFTDNEVTLQHTAPARPARSITENLIGGNIGGGFDYQLTRSLVGRLEYIFDQYGTQNYGFTALTAGEFVDRQVKMNEHTVRAALMFRF